MALVGKKFPNFDVDAMNEMGDTFKINVYDEAVKNGKKVLLFWYPKDFTFVCPTEIRAFQDALSEFEKRNTVVIGASVDTAEVHFELTVSNSLEIHNIPDSRALARSVLCHGQKATHSARHAPGESP